MDGKTALERIGGTALDRAIGDEEKKLRIELATAFRIAHHFGWNKDTLNHITLRLPGTDNFLMNPLGLGWDEITASSLATTDYDAKVSSHAGVRLAPAGFNFHSGILKARPDLNCVMHVHAVVGTVIGSLEEGLLVFNQSGYLLHNEVGYHNFEGLANENDEVPRILRDLGTKHTLLMTNHGLLTVGATVGEAFGWMRALIDACALQERVMATGGTMKVLPASLQAHTKAQMSGGRNGPREDLSWNYWKRLAERLDPDYAN